MRSDSGDFGGVECAVGVLTELVSNERAGPIKRAIGGATGFSWAPAPDETVSAVGGSFAGKETAAIEVSLLAVGPEAGIVGGAGFEFVDGATLEVLHATDGIVLLGVNEVPPVAHLK